MKRFEEEILYLEYHRNFKVLESCPTLVRCYKKYYTTVELIKRMDKRHTFILTLLKPSNIWGENWP